MKLLNTKYLQALLIRNILIYYYYKQRNSIFMYAALAAYATRPSFYINPKSHLKCKLRRQVLDLRIEQLFPSTQLRFENIIPESNNSLDICTDCIIKLGKVGVLPNSGRANQPVPVVAPKAEVDVPQPVTQLAG